MVSEAEVEMAYRLFLGREPESHEMVARHIQSASTLRTLRENFLLSKEFEDALAKVSPRPVIRPWDEPYTRIDTDMPPEVLDRLVRHVEASWTALGEQEPHWSVLTNELFRSHRIKENEAAFFQSGVAAAAMFQRSAERCGIDVSDFAEQTCFELGCGVGRITLPLTRLFDLVIATDISASHLKVAEQVLSGANRHNVEFVHLAAVDIIRRLPRVDVFLSIIVLQHNPPPLMKLLLQTCLQRLRPNGIGYFQLPFYAAGYQFSSDEYTKRIDTPDARRGLEMHVLPQPVIFEAVANAGCQVLEMLEDGWCGEGFRSCSLLVRRI